MAPLSGTEGKKLLSGKRVLVVDDEEAFRNALKAALEQVNKVYAIRYSPAALRDLGKPGRGRKGI